MKPDVIELREDDFDREVLGAQEPVLVDFHAEWCGPCRTLSPILEELAVELRGSMRVARVDIDEEPGLAARYDVFSIPTMILFQGGSVRKRLIGALPKRRLQDELREFVR